MSSAIWGEPKPTNDEHYPLKLLKGLLQDVLKQVPAYGGCLALYDESINQMVIRVHMRRYEYGEDDAEVALDTGKMQARPTLRRNTMKLADKPTPFPEGSGSIPQEEERFAVVTATRATALFPPGSVYAPGQDLVGICWRGNQPFHVSHEKYQELRSRF